MYETIELFGQKVDIKNYDCVNCGQTPYRQSMRLNLYIKITDMCNANCDACSNRGNEKKSDIDLNKLKMVVKYLNERELINRISITGGEPMLNINKLNNLLNSIYEVKPDALVTINTNGFNITNLPYLDSKDKLYGVHISRHHYLDEKNDEFFGIKTSTLSDIEKVMNQMDNKQLLRLNSLLMKKYINNIDEVSKYLEMASDLEIFRVGFVSLMQINDYSKENFINFNDIFNNLPEKFIKTNDLHDLNICECVNGLYLGNNGSIVEYYARMTKELNCDYARQFVYTSDNQLTVGFNKKPLI